MAEVTAAGKPAIFVPLPTAADDHQRHNAEVLAYAGAAGCYRRQNSLQIGWRSEVSGLLADRVRLAGMGDRRRPIRPSRCGGGNRRFGRSYRWRLKPPGCSLSTCWQPATGN